MRFPGRALLRWKQRYVARHRAGEVRKQLTQIFGQSIRLQFVVTGGGTDLIYQAHLADSPKTVVACVRLGQECLSLTPDEPNLPRRMLSMTTRIEREADIYRRLAPEKVTPRLLAQSTDFLANEWLPWPRLSDVLRNREASLWDVLPLVFEHVARMHSAGIMHLDLNCGNILVSRDLSAVAFIDFEYGPPDDLPTATLQAFDYVRHTHNLLKRRRGLDEVCGAPQRYIDLLLRYIPFPEKPVLRQLHPECFDRIRRLPILAEGFRELFGELPANAVRSVKKSAINARTREIETL